MIQYNYNRKKENFMILVDLFNEINFDDIWDYIKTKHHPKWNFFVVYTIIFALLPYSLP